MNNKQQEWGKQLLSNLRLRELLRLTGVLLAVQFTGIALGLVLKNFGIALIFIGVTFGILWLFPYWQPAYAIIYKIMGNQSISPVLPTYQRKWWSYISIAMKVLMVLAVLGIGLKLLFQ